MERIKALVDEIYPFKKIADVGCDHGYLIIESFKKYNLDNAIAIDNKKGPLDMAISNIKNYDFFNKVRFSLSSGISDIDDDTECVIIAGMGGLLITDLVSDNLRNVKRFIIQPNRNIMEVRKKLCSLGFYISNEKVIIDANKYYEIITFDKGSQEYSNIEYEFGPILLQNKSKEFKDKYLLEIDRLSKIINDNNKDEISRKIERIKSICL